MCTPTNGEWSGWCTIVVVCLGLQPGELLTRLPHQTTTLCAGEQLPSGVQLHLQRAQGSTTTHSSLIFCAQNVSRLLSSHTRTTHS